MENRSGRFDGSDVAVGSGNDAGDGLGESGLEEQNDAGFVDVVDGPKDAVFPCDPESESSATCAFDLFPRRL